MQKRPRTAVIPAAGRGTRFLPVTRAVAKELLPLVDTPTIHHIVLEAALSGIERVVLVSGKGKSAIEDYFDHDFTGTPLERVKVITIRQEKALGLGHAILCAQPVVGDEPFAVLLGDDVIVGDPPCTKQLIDVFMAQNGAPVVGVMEVEAPEVSKYGIVGGDTMSPNLMRVKTLVEKPSMSAAPSRMAIPGRYILTPEIFSMLRTAKPGMNGEIQLTDSLQTLADTTPLFALKFQGRRFDAGDKLGYLEANIHFALQREELRPRVQAMLKKLLESSGK